MMRSRVSRSPPLTRSASVLPWAPMMTTGLSRWPSDRRWRFCFSVSLDIRNHSVSAFIRPQSIPSPRRRFWVAASPFNAVKLDVIVIGCDAILGAAWLDRARVATSLQLVFFALYGLVGALWIVMRVRRILRESRKADTSTDLPAHQEVSPHHGQD